ncbi:MAG: alpha/beta hydrolase [Ignavibacteria bacterium]|nr:alpha/beta hydrolase [Ignavibacteria bacterium]
MKTIRSLVVLFSILLMGIAFPQHAKAKHLAGDYLGKLSFNGTSLRIVFHFTHSDSAGWQATLDSPDQKVFGLKGENFSVKGDSFSAGFKMVGGSLTGKIITDSLLKCVWSQNSMKFQIELKKTQYVPEKPARPQTPKKPYPYTEQGISFENKEAGVKLAGTLTYPKEGTNIPVVVLVTGSGPQNRDEEIFGHQPFWVIADYLSRNGIAVLRYDDRGVGASTGDFSTSTTLDFAEDAAAAIAFAREQTYFKPGKVGIIGHSEGGLIAELLASRNVCDFAVLLAAPGVSGDRILLQQGALMGKATGASAENLAKATEISREIYTAIKTEKDIAKLSTLIESKIRAQSPKLSDTTSAAYQQVAASIKAQIAQLTSPWYRFFINFDPEQALKNITVPVLALGGSKDLQVPADSNLTVIQKYLELAGNKHFEVKKIEGVNHLFQSAITGYLNEYAQIEETIKPEVLMLMKDFIIRYK